MQYGLKMNGVAICLLSNKAKEKQLAGAPSDASCRHSMYTVFLYYCDFRANPRRTPGDILIKDCTFENPNALFNLQFDGHQVWCCNRSLAEITFENCRVTGVSEPVQIYGDEKEPLSFTMKNVTLAARPGFEGEAVIDARNFEKICLEDVALEDYEKPTILCRTEGAVEVQEDGSVATGWQIINGRARYFSDTGAMRTGWLESS